MIASTPAAAKRRQIAPRQVEGGAFDPRVVIDRAAARLAGWNHDFAAVFLEDARRGRIGFGKHGVRHTSEEKRDPCPFRSDRGQDLGQMAVRRAEPRQHCLHASQGRRQQAKES